MTPRTQYLGAPTDWDIFRDILFFGNRANRDDPTHVSNIFGSRYNPQVWGSNVPANQRNLIAHWKRALSQFTGATWNDVALAYAVPLSTIEQFSASANADVFPVIRAVWQNPMLPDSIKRPALGLIVQTFGLSPWEWAQVVGLDEATAVQVLNVPVPIVAATLQRNVSPAVQATASEPGFVVSTHTGEVAVIPAGSDPFTDAGFTNDASGRRLAVLIYAMGNDRNELVFIDPTEPPSDRPIKPASLARLRDLLGMVQRLVGERQRNITSSETPNFERYLIEAGALAVALGLTETELAQFLGLTLDQFRAIYVFDAAGFGIAATREVVTVPSELPTLTAPSAQALEPVAQVFYFQFPADFAEYSAEQKARFYLAMLAQGFTDAQIRITAESTFGPQSDSDWFALQQIAAALVAADAAAAAALAAAAAEAAALAAPTSSAAAATQQAAQMAQDAADTAAQAVTVQEAQDAAQTAIDAVNFVVELQVVVYGPDGTPYGTYSAAKRAGLRDDQISYEPPSAPVTQVPAVPETPTTGAPAMPQLPANLGTMTEAQKIAWYRATLAAGFTNEAIRAAVEARYGRQSDSDWTYLRAKAAQTAAQTAASAGGAGLLIAAAAAYFLLG